jgi:D-alanyl-D-alanine carboxypeptidase/D-alanyl-D-alanine-endopeptidase (penicillin-binding protein 4)
VRRGARALAAILVAGCVARHPTEPLAPEVRSLAAELDSSLDGPEFSRAQWGVVVQSATNGQVLYRRNAARLFMPASNQKILTGTVALARLGADFRWKTVILARGTRHGDTLSGDLIVVGHGDPALSQHASANGDILAPLRPWADSLKARGIRVITGRVVGDASWFQGPVLGEGWMWDDLQDSYSAPVGALQFNEGFAVIDVTPGTNPGDSAHTRLWPETAPLRVFSQVTTAPRDSNIQGVHYERAFYTDSVLLSGRLSAGHAPLQFEAAVTDPTRYFEDALTQALREAGISVLGPRLPPAQTLVPASPLVVLPAASPAPASLSMSGCTCCACSPAPDTLFTWQSPRLDSVLILLEKPSQNQIAEALLRTLGGVVKNVASVDSGRAVIHETLTSWGIPEDSYVYIDGSGLSRYNYVAPEALAQALVAITRNPDFNAFYSALPIAGVDGSIDQRLKGTAAQGNAHAKTGSIANVRSLSGYVTTLDGERLVFVILCNHFTTSRRVVERVQDHVVERLANFMRRRR